MAFYTTDEIEREIERFAGGIDILRSAVAGLSPDQFRERPVPGKWSMLECVCHMADFEPILAYRMKCMLSFDRPELVGIDESAYAAGLHYTKRDIIEELNIFTSTRSQLLTIFGALEPGDWSRTGMHTELGEISFFAYLKGASGHLEHHMQHMNDKRVALGLPPVPCADSRDYPARPD